MIKVGVGVFVLAGVLFFYRMLSVRQIRPPFTIREGKGIENFMNIDDSFFLSFLANPARTIYGSRYLICPAFGMESVRGGGRVVVACPSSTAVSMLKGSEVVMEPFTGFEPNLGVIDENLDQERVLDTFGHLPIVDYRPPGERFVSDLLYLGNYPRGKRYYSLREGGPASISWYYINRGISFDFDGRKITSISVYPPRQLDERMCRFAGRLFLGHDGGFDFGVIKAFEGLSLLVLHLENNTLSEVELGLALSENCSALVGELGTGRLRPNESTTLSIAVDSALVQHGTPETFIILVFCRFSKVDDREKMLLIRGSVEKHDLKARGR